jgi:HPt (histidine-containing phosphotransfer) domain-containing protein
MYSMKTINNVHVDSIKMICGEDSVLVNEMLHTCLVQCEEAKDQIMGAYVANDVATLAWVVHRAKPMVHYLGAGMLFDLLQKLEDSLKMNAFCQQEILLAHSQFENIGSSLRTALIHSNAA